MLNLYILQTEGLDTERIKIGVAKDVTTRTEDIQSMSPIQLILLYTEQGRDALIYRRETSLHNTLSSFHLWGEWFFFDDTVVALLRNEGVNFLISEQEYVTTPTNKRVTRQTYDMPTFISPLLR